MSPPPQQDMQTCVLKVNTHCQGCKRKVRNILKKVQGVYGVEVDAGQGRATVTGVAEPEVLINKLAKSGKPAEVLEPAKGGQLKSIILPSSDNGQKGQIVKTKIIQPDDATNQVQIPMGMKVVKEVKVLAYDQDDELRSSDYFTLLGAKDGGVSDGDADGRSVAKGKGSEGVRKGRKKGDQQDGKKGGQIDNMKRPSRLEAALENKFSNRKANGGWMGGFSKSHEARGAKTAKMAQMPPAQVSISDGGYFQADVPYGHPQQQHHVAPVMMNHPQRPMANNDIYHHPMKYSQPDGSGQVPLPPPPAADPLAHIFNDENANGCSIM